MNTLRLAASHLRLCHRRRYVIRTFSVQSTVESTAQTQTGLFKFLSESTPVEYLQGLLLNVHDYTGLPWWATIVCTTFMLRGVITVPLSVYQQYIIAKVENIGMEMPEVSKELKKEVGMAIKMYGWDERTAKFHFRRSMKKQWRNRIERDNCHPFKASLLIWFQIPLWVSLSVSLRNLVYMLPEQDISALVTHTELTVGGFGWIPNLTEIDDTYILPVALALINLTIIEVQNLSSVRVPTKFHRYVTNIFRGVAILMIPITSSIPSCLALYWTASSAFGLVQNLVLMSPRIKRFCRIPPSPSQLEKPYSHLIAAFQHKFFRKKE